MNTDRGVIFDCDGTLVDSERLCNLVMAEALAELGVQEAEEDLLGRYRGARMAYILADLERRHSLRLPLAFERLYRSRVAVRFERDLSANPGVKPMLEELRGRAALAVASSAPREKIELALRVTEISFGGDDEHWFPRASLLFGRLPLSPMGNSAGRSGAPYRRRRAVRLARPAHL